MKIKRTCDLCCGQGFTIIDDEVVKVCKVHGNLTANDVLLTKDKHKDKIYHYKVCKLCSKKSKSKWNKKNLAYYREKNKKNKVADRVNLNDSYVKSLITSGSLLSAKDIPQELVDVHRSNLILKRKVRGVEND